MIAVMVGMQMFVIPAVAQVENKLYFSNVGNKLYYDSTRFEEARFMYHIEMSPGNTFRDQLLIENSSSLPYDLYFQVIPIVQSEIADELLEYIDMKIYLDGVLMYDGKVTGKDYSEDDVHLRQVVYIGEYLPGKESLMTVDLAFSPEYAAGEEVWSRIDWKFWGVGEHKDPEPMEPGPQMGDPYQHIKIIGIAAVISAGWMIFLSTRKRKQGTERG